MIALPRASHVSVTVRDLDRAMEFFAPLLQFLGYRTSKPLRNPSTDSRLVVNINPTNGVAFNVWEAKRELASHAFQVYEPGLHHVAWNVGSREQVDDLHEKVRALGVRILDAPERAGNPLVVYAARRDGRCDRNVLHLSKAPGRDRDPGRGGVSG
jgi:catechol 2,3-dioxygenase-like lactoylglutathione lyase family enzyme